MTKTTTRQRAVNLYTVEQDGQPVAQAMAISQAEAVALWIASQQQPVLSARLSTPIEARTLASLPLLSRDTPAAPAPGPQPERDPRVLDMFEDMRPFAEIVDAEWSASDVVPVTHHVDEVLTMAPEAAAEQPGEPEPSAPSTAAPTVTPAPVAAEQATADEPTHAERMASAYAAGVELGKQGASRWGAEFLATDTACTDGLTSGKQIDEVGAELRRGFDFGRASVAEKTPKQELEPQDEQAAARRANGGKPAAMYRDPATGQSWSGRGLKPRWLVEAIEAGRTQDEFLIEGAQA